MLANEKDPYHEADVNRDDDDLVMCDLKRLGSIRNGVIRNKVEVKPIEDKMRETILRWFGHVNRRGMEGPMRIYKMIYRPKCIRGKERSKKKLGQGD